MWTKLIIFGLFFLASCVGTVEQADLAKTVTEKTEETDVTFQGVQLVKAISQNRIEVFFYPAVAGSGKYIYKIYYGDDLVAAVPSDILVPDYRGYLMYTLTNLERGRDYFIRVTATDQNNAVEVDRNLVRTARTFNNLVADFSGISAVSNLQGVDGKDSIRIRWSHASVLAGSAGNELNPRNYELILMDANKGSPSDLDNSLLTESNGRYLRVIDYNPAVYESVVRGLPSGTKFYVRVRAIHKASVDDVTQPTLRSEQNSKYMVISTFGDGAADIVFDFEKVVVTSPPGAAALNALEISWPSAVGLFDHYRLFFAEDDGMTFIDFASVPDFCSPAAPVNGIWCRKIAYTESFTTIANLLPLTKYNVVLAICLTPGCEKSDPVTGNPNMLLADVKQGETNPQMASFKGLKEVISARRLSEVGRAVLKFDAPDFTQGHFDGLAVAYKQSINDPSDIPVVLSDPSYTGPMIVPYFDYRYANEIVIPGVDYADPQTHCFSVYPFNYKDDGSREEYPNDIWHCMMPQVRGPTADDFAGLDSVIVGGSNYLEMFWTLPLQGVYDSYEIIARKTAGTFNFGAALTELGTGTDSVNYRRLTITNPDATTAVMDMLPDGTYRIGIITRYINPLSGTPVDSEYNSAIFSCAVVTNPTEVNCTRLNP
jgi:hypothetical protein